MGVGRQKDLKAFSTVTKANSGCYFVAKIVAALQITFRKCQKKQSSILCFVCFEITNANNCCFGDNQTCTFTMFDFVAINVLLHHKDNTNTLTVQNFTLIDRFRKVVSSKVKQFTRHSTFSASSIVQ